MKISILCCPIVLTAVLYGCSKKNDNVIAPETESSLEKNKLSELTIPGASLAPDYGDTIFCYKWNDGKDFKISPINKAGKGKYVSKPDGLVLDENTGEINVTKSESGMGFKIGFIPYGTTDTAFSNIYTSGVDYVGGIHILSEGDTIVSPYYYGTDEKFTDAEFDDDNDDDNGNGTIDEPAVGQTLSSLNVSINKATGVIDLKKSVTQKVFGNSPANGKTVDATLYYRISDCSERALRKINLKFIYYQRLSDVPSSYSWDNNNINGVKGYKGFRSMRVSETSVVAKRPPQIVVVANR